MPLCSVCGGWYEEQDCPDSGYLPLYFCPACYENAMWGNMLLLFESPPTPKTSSAPEISQETSPETSSFKISFSVGGLFRGRVLGELKEYLFLHGLEYEIEEDKGWLVSFYRMKIKGNSDAITEAHPWVDAYFDWWQKKTANNEEVKA